MGNPERVREALERLNADGTVERNANARAEARRRGKRDVADVDRVRRRFRGRHADDADHIGVVGAEHVPEEG